MGDPITVRWTDGPANRWDWIGVYRADAADPEKDDYLVWGYTGGHDAGALPPSTEGELVLGRDHQGKPWPLPPGRYVVHYLLTDQYTSVGIDDASPCSERSDGSGRLGQGTSTRGRASMPIEDVGPRPASFDLEAATTGNEHYRSVVWSGTYLQVTLMSIPVGESIGLEMHADTDQFLRLDAGRGKVRMGPAQDDLSFQQDVGDGWSCSCRPAPGTTWSTPATSRCGSTPSTHPFTTQPGMSSATAADAERDEASGDDEPRRGACSPRGAGRTSTPTADPAEVRGVSPGSRGNAA